MRRERVGWFGRRGGVVVDGELKIVLKIYAWGWRP